MYKLDGDEAGEACGIASEATAERMIRKFSLGNLSALPLCLEANTTYPLNIQKQGCGPGRFAIPR